MKKRPKILISPGEPSGIGYDILFDLVNQKFSSDIIVVTSCNLLLERESKVIRNKNFKVLPNKNFSIGDTVMHPDFGEGKILGVNGKKLQIKFQRNSDIVSVFSDFVEKV